MLQATSGGVYALFPRRHAFGVAAVARANRNDPGSVVGRNHHADLARARAFGAVQVRLIMHIHDDGDRTLCGRPIALCDADCDAVGCHIPLPMYKARESNCFVCRRLEAESYKEASYLLTFL